MRSGDRGVVLYSVACAVGLASCFGKGFDLSAADGSAGGVPSGRGGSSAMGGTVASGDAAAAAGAGGNVKRDALDAPSAGGSGGGTGAGGVAGILGSGGAGATTAVGSGGATSTSQTGRGGGTVSAGGIAAGGVPSTGGLGGGAGTGGAGPACTNTQTDYKNCGACGFDCGALKNVRALATPPDVQCLNGVCVLQPSACVSGFGHCTSNAKDGCETSLTSITDCGTCNNRCVAPLGVCSTKSSPAVCASSCVAPAPDLCGASCVDTASDPKHCGSCTRDCTTLPNVRSGAAVQCAAGRCVIPPSACVPGFASCTAGTDDTDGCETATTTLTNCGGCNQPCSFPNATASCATGTCTLTSCTNGFKLCNGSCLPADQCCVDADCPQARANACVRPVCSNHACTFVAQAGSCPAGGTCQVSTSTCVRPAVSVGSYDIDATEVTRGQYLAFLQAKGGSVSGQPAVCSWNTSYQPSNEWPPSVEDYDMPVGWVDWCDAYAYCAWAGRRLCGKIGGGPNLTDDYNNPALSQWMQACVGPSNTAYPYGNTFDPARCNGPLSNTYGPVSVGQKASCVGGYPGLFDMSGNVWEWEDSCLGSTGATDFCRERGSSFVPTRDDASGIFLRCDSNNNNPRQSDDSSVGFRCCGG